MQATIAKQFTFHAAHRLPNHNGPCRDLHGHSYRLEVAVTGRVKAATGQSDEGMVLDFQVLKDIYKDHIEPFVEHKYLNETLIDEVPLTTCEALAAWFYSVFKRELDDNKPWGYEICVKVWETPTSFAEVGKKWRE